MAMCHLYGVDYAMTTDLVRLADASSETNYVEDGNGKGVEERYWMFADLEESATVQLQYCSELVNGVFQTPEYARAVIGEYPGMTAEVVERRVAFRMARQRAFFERPEPGRVEMVIHASVLNAVAGSPEVMEAQIARLLAAEEKGEARIWVLTAANRIHGATTGPFTTMDFDDPDDPSVVCLPSLIGTRYVERKQQVATYREAFEALRRHAVPLREYLSDERNNPMAQGEQEQ